MSYTTLKEAKKEANRIGGVVTWWVTYGVVKAKDYTESMGLPKFVSRKARIFFMNRYRKKLKRDRIRLQKTMKQLRKEYDKQTNSN